MKNPGKEFTLSGVGPDEILSKTGWLNGHPVRSFSLGDLIIWNDVENQGFYGEQSYLIIDVDYVKMRATALVRNGHILAVHKLDYCTVNGLWLSSSRTWISLE